MGKQVGQPLTGNKWKEMLFFPFLSGQAGTKSGSWERSAKIHGFLLLIKEFFSFCFLFLFLMQTKRVSLQVCFLSCFFYGLDLGLSHLL